MRPRPRRPRHRGAVRAAQHQRGLGHRLPVRHADQLADRRQVRRRRPRRARPGRPAGPAATRRGRRRPAPRSVAGQRGPAARPTDDRERSALHPSPSDEPRPMATRSAASVLRAIRQPSPRRADHAVVGYEHVVQEDLVEHGPAGDLAQRADVDAGECMSTRKYVSPRCLGAPGRCAPGRSPSPPPGPATSTPSARSAATRGRLAVVHPTALVRSEARSDPASGSLNSWHQVISPRSVGPANRSRWAGVPCCTTAAAAQPPMHQVGPVHPGPGQFARRWRTRRRGEAAKAVGRAASAAPHNRRRRGRRRSGGRVAPRQRHGPRGLAAGCRTFGRPVPAPPVVSRRRRDPGQGQFGGAAQPGALPPSSWRRASARRRYRWASCSQVKPMPPSTWMQSLALSTAASRATRRPRPRPAGARPAPRRRARAASQATAAARSARQSMPAHRCLTAWKAPIGRPNWCRVWAYSAAVRSTAGHAGRLGGVQGGGQVADPAAGGSPARICSGPMAAGEPDGGQRPGEVDAARRSVDA